jgi:methyl acetate hydrolase
MLIKAVYSSLGREAAMNAMFRASANAILRKVTTGEPKLPGAVAMACKRAGTLYEGAAGFRRLGEAELMTTESALRSFPAPRSRSAG